MKKTKLNPISKSKHRREKRFVPESVLKAVKDRSGGRCEAGWPIVVGDKFIKEKDAVEFVRHRCLEKAMNQPHHKLKRSQGGKHTLENLMDVCFEHHRWIEDHSKDAAELGWHIPYEGYTNEPK